MSVAVHQYTYQHVAHPGCPCVSVRTHRTSVAVRVCPSAHTGHPWLSISTHINTLVLGLCTLALPVDCLGDFGPRGLSVQYTQDVRGCPSAHTGRPCVSVSTHRTSVAVRVYVCADKTSVAVHQYTYQHVVHTGRPWVSASTHRTSMVVRVCPCVSVCVRLHTQDYTQDVCGCPPAHTGHPWLSMAVRQHTQDVCASLCVSVSTHRTSLDVRVCLSVSFSTHMTSVAVHQYTFQHVVPWTQHAGPSG
ncbi:hypothetical protein YC2023_108711 [Brassica napus]